MTKARPPVAPVRLWQGFWCPARAIGLIARTPRLRALAAAPTAVSVLLFGGWIWAAVQFGQALVNRFWTTAGGAPAWLNDLHWLAVAFASLLITVLGGAVYFFGGQILAEPFLDPLSEGAERAIGIEHAGGRFSVGRLVRGLLCVLRDVAVDLSLWLLCLLAVLLIGLLPGLGHILAPVLGWLVNATFAAVEVSGSALSRRGYVGLARWRALRGDLPRLLGLGLAVMLMLMIPLAQVLVLPIAVVAGALAVVDAEACGLLAAPNADGTA